MKQPKMSNLVIDRKSTQQMRASIAKTKKIKITINIDENSLNDLRQIAGKAGASYQKLLNQILREGLQKKHTMESRLNRIEAEIERLNQKIAA